MSWPEIYPRDMEKALLSNDAKDYPFVFKCGNPECQRGPTAHRTHEDAGRVMQHHKETQCPQKISVHHGKGITEELKEKMVGILDNIWSELDAATSAVMSEKPDTDPAADPEAWKVYNEKRGNARGLAMAIFHLSTPFYETATDVAKLAVKRHKAKVAGEEMPATPGIGGTNSPELIAAREGAHKKEQAEKPAAKKAAPKKATPKGELDESQKEAIITGIKAKLPHASLAKLYKIDESVVAEIAASLQATA